jgi:uncharacterized membrane protein YgdD (TMEM256/DUF423 family)
MPALPKSLNNMHKGFLLTATLLGALSVGLGAFGAHLLKNLLSAQALNTFETAVRYQFYHVFALALTGILFKTYPHKFTRYAGIFFILGIVFFSGSLYQLTWLTSNGNGAFKWIGAVTPLGGLLFILGWLFLALGIRNSRIQ